MVSLVEALQFLKGKRVSRLVGVLRPVNRYGYFKTKGEKRRRRSRRKKERKRKERKKEKKKKKEKKEKKRGQFFSKFWKQGFIIVMTPFFYKVGVKR